ncbi:MAG: cell envelope integrity protein TolA [Gammaproteobacteria bacterium]|nr:cell envelope integrity protein TolA [Gammaproteobacteria bacterium]
MWEAIRKNPRAAVAALLAHIVFIVLLVVSFKFSDDEDIASQNQQKMEVVKAEAVDERKINAELDRLRRIEKQKQDKVKREADKAKREADKAKQARLAEQKRLVEAKKKRRQEEQQKKAAEKKRKDAERKRKLEAAAEKKRLEKLKKEKEETERKLKEEEKRKQEEERQQQEELARQEAELKRKLEAEQKQAAARNAAKQTEINKYRILIKQEVTRRWIVPNMATGQLSCDVKVKIFPGGDVAEVLIIRSSGNKAFDRSVEKAVERAAPLPVPKVDSGLFDEFREVIFSFEPKNISEFG